MIASKALEEFLINQQVKGNTKDTYIYYKKRIGYFVNFLKDKEVSEINMEDYNKYVLYLKEKKKENGEKLSSATIKTELNSIKIFLSFCYKKGYTLDNFYINIPAYKLTKKTIVVLSDLEIKKLISSQNEYTPIGIRNLLAISFMLDAGLRVSEVVNLDFTDVSEELGLIRVFGKGQKERLVPLTDSIKKYYRKYVFLTGKTTGAIFTDINTGERMTASGISQILRRIKKEVGFKKLHPHYLRHTFATLFLVNGGDPVHLQLILGHETLFMTENYLHIATQMTMPEKKKYSPLSNIN